MHDFSCSYLYISTYQTKLNQSILKKYDLRDYIKLLFLITHPKSSRSRASRPSAGTVAQHWAPNFPREEVVCSPLLFVRCSISLSNIIISKILGMSTIIRSFMSSRLLAATWPGISSSSAYYAIPLHTETFFNDILLMIECISSRDSKLVQLFCCQCSFTFVSSRKDYASIE